MLDENFEALMASITAYCDEWRTSRNPRRLAERGVIFRLVLTKTLPAVAQRFGAEAAGDIYTQRIIEFALKGVRNPRLDVLWDQLILKAMPMKQVAPIANCSIRTAYL